MEPGITYCSAFPEDSVFGVLHNAHNYIWTGSCMVNLEYKPEGMRTAVLHALASSTNSTTSFLAVLVLPVWEDTLRQSAAIRNHANIETLIQITTGHMRLSPPIANQKKKHKT
jgi:hypothetical protein